MFYGQLFRDHFEIVKRVHHSRQKPGPRTTTAHDVYPSKVLYLVEIGQTLFQGGGLRQPFEFCFA